ncbi:hypothetical protein L2E82_50865 [Cichorium intybus]|nr:hypothetical protein L2E82_50865 [Cichorium intybus]
MVMESLFHENFDYSNNFSLDDENTLPVLDQFPGHTTGYRFKDEPLDLSILDTPRAPNHDAGTVNSSLQEDSSDEFDYVYKLGNQILSEDNMENTQGMFDDPLSLQATEKSLYEELGKIHPPQPPPSLNFSLNVESPEEISCQSSGEHGSRSSISGGDSFEIKSPLTQTHSLNSPPFGPTIKETDSMANAQMAQNIFTDQKSILQFQKGMEEARKFLPSIQPLITDLDKCNLPSNNPPEVTVKVENIETYDISDGFHARKHSHLDKYNLPSNNPPEVTVKVENIETYDISDGFHARKHSHLDKYNLPSNNPPEVTVKVENIETYDISDGFRARKHSHLEDNNDEDERSSKVKPSVIYEEEEAQLSEMFDRILFCCNNKSDTFPDCHSVNKHRHANNHWHTRSWRSVTSDSFDIRTLLINCAQSVASDDHQIATQQLQLIRQHASPTGNDSQRLAHVFALGLEARLAGTGSHLYATQNALKISATENLKAFQVYVTASPFIKNDICFANRTIYEASVNSSSLHIVDFGIAYGFQWLILIKHLSDRPGGPPKLRITGIDRPEAGFRPAEKIEETGRRLASYCRRFQVPFEYNSIAVQNWETIRVEDLKLRRNEFLAVNALTVFENLLDETVMEDSPRDSVLKMIREMKPDVFVHSVVNGSYNAPFFITRFREALFHYSALFDMFDATLERGNVHRGNFERQYGHEVVNVVACEGRERVERPESYKQWQLRNMRAGFKAKGMNRELVSQFKRKVKAVYHKDFLFDDDGIWLLQGWKGRILYAISCWVTA